MLGGRPVRPKTTSIVVLLDHDRLWKTHLPDNAAPRRTTIELGIVYEKKEMAELSGMALPSQNLNKMQGPSKRGSD